MQAILEIITKVYKIVNVTTVKAVIGGNVYRSKAPDNSSSENIEIISGANVNDIVQEATLFVNYHVQNLPDGSINESKMKTLSAILIPLLEADVDSTVISDEIFSNQERAGWAFYSVRLKVQAFNDQYTE